VNAVSRAPVNAVSRAPVNVVSPVPANAVSRAPAKTVSGIPSNVVSFVPAKTVSRVPANVVTPVSVNTVSRVPANVVSFVPAKTVSGIPSNVVSPVPANTVIRVQTIEASSVPAIADASVWLLVDTKAHKIEIKKGEQTIETLNGIAIGRRGAGLKTKRGDDITPYGNYRIGWVGEKSNFRKFFGLTYPSTQDAEIALKRGIITEQDYYSIKVAHQYNQIPPQNTPLGGQIGIHGLGSGDEKVHQVFDWTHGCIALTNSQIDHLSQWLDTGTVVKIR
jgi:L,D-peptidoglycan transpeptidase YkuD (ErfK/YbiS/YcfS/YnhG family)